MKHGLLAATLSALLFALTAHAITVDGYVFLSGQADHTGTLIMFRAVSPSGRTDSTHSVSTGYYVLSLQPGVYDVEFRHTGFTAYQRPGQILFLDTTLVAATLLQGISGPQTGVLARGTYDVIGTLRVAGGQTWTIAAGTQLLFRPQIPLIVNGTLLAIGSAGDSIVFAPRIEHPDSAWGGVQFLNASGLCRLDYCVIEGAHGLVNTWSPTVFTSVGAVACVNSNPTIEHSTICRNWGAEEGGGVYCWGSSPVLRDCAFWENSAGLFGSAAALYGSSGRMERCRFHDNFFAETIYCASNTSTRFAGCSIMGDYDAVYCHEASPIMDSCLIKAELSLFCYGAGPQLSRCTIVGAVRLIGSAAVIHNSVLFYRGSSYAALSFETGTNAEVTYTAIFCDGGELFSGLQDWGPPALGIVAFTNANGDSCDTYYNIFLDPQFVDTAAGDYHLMAGSPCIDAGDPSLPHDPDGTVADMGAFYFNQLAVPDPERTAVRHYQLAQNYPNPFNAETRIVFDLARAGEIRLEVFDITGRLVRTLVNGMMTEGSHEITLDARELPSGVYVYRLATEEVIEARKMILIR
jgi:hypothetical protein